MPNDADTTVIWTWEQIMKKTIPIFAFMGCRALGSMYLFMLNPDGTRVGQIEFCMN